jgi:hypothetical protein
MDELNKLMDHFSMSENWKHSQSRSEKRNKEEFEVSMDTLASQMEGISMNNDDSFELFVRDNWERIQESGHSDQRLIEDISDKTEPNFNADNLIIFKCFYENLYYFSDYDSIHKIHEYMDIINCSDYYDCHKRFFLRHQRIQQLYEELAPDITQYHLIKELLRHFFVYYLEIQYINVLDLNFTDISIDESNFIISDNKKDHRYMLKGLLRSF